MNSYKITAPQGLSLPANTAIRLTAEQLSRRLHLVTELKRRKGVYVSDHALGFKLDEEIAIDAELPPILAQLVSPIVDKAAADKAVERKAIEELDALRIAADDATRQAADLRAVADQKKELLTTAEASARHPDADDAIRSTAGIAKTEFETADRAAATAEQEAAKASAALQEALRKVEGSQPSLFGRIKSALKLG